MNPLIYRDYQIRCHDAIFEQWETHTSTLAVLPVGAGKTVIFGKVIKTMQPKRALVLAHRAELIYQARDRIAEATGLSVGIEMADSRASLDMLRDEVVIATVQSMNSRGRMARFNPMDFGLVVIDETHHATSDSYRKIINYFKAGNPNIKILGVTATPKRRDEEALSQIFESNAFSWGILDGVDEGWLVDVVAQRVVVQSLDLSHIHVRDGDFNHAELEAIMEVEKNVQGICHPSLEVVYGLETNTLSSIPQHQWRDYLAGLNRAPRRAIMFTASVKQAEMACNLFNRVMPGIAEWICGTTNKERRKWVLDRFKNGEISVMVNCAVLTEGYDNPYVQVILMAKPTLSLAHYEQMVGRSTRPLPGVVDGLLTKDERRKAIGGSDKPYCRIVDFVGNSGKHKLISPVDVLGGRVSEGARMRAQGELMKGRPKMICRTLSNAEVAIKREQHEAAERARQMEEERKKSLVAKSKFTVHEVDPFDKWNSHSQDKRKVWTGKGPSALLLRPRQINVLRKAGYNPAAIPLGYGKKLVGVILHKWYPDKYPLESERNKNERQIVRTS
jgi:superfamily II DNA or RNA helicase